MPKLPSQIQEPMALYPAVERLNASNGVLTATIEQFDDLINPEGRITIGRLASIYGGSLGPRTHAESEDDIMLEVTERDFERAEPWAIENGLYIPANDARYRDPATEQLVRVRKDNEPREGVVFPSSEFHIVARNAPDLAKHVMAKARRANKTEADMSIVEGRVGRSAAHAMHSKIQGLNKLESTLLETRKSLLIPLYRETYSNWQAHFKAKNLDKRRRAFDEELHEVIDTASINLNVGSTAIKATHRAIASNLYRRGSSTEINQQWQRYVHLVGRYIAKRHAKVVTSRDQCEDQLSYYEPFLHTQPAA